MNYLKSEHLKFKRTISNKLLFIIPLITTIFAWIVGGFMGFQYTALYWWYAFLLPGATAILCALSHNRNLMCFVTQKRRKRREILFCIFYACEPFKI